MGEQKGLPTCDDVAPLETQLSLLLGCEVEQCLDKAVPSEGGAHRAQQDGVQFGHAVSAVECDQLVDAVEPLGPEVVLPQLDVSQYFEVLDCVVKPAIGDRSQCSKTLQPPPPPT